MTDEAGHTFTYTVEQTAIVKYACQPPKAMGMKGAIAVGGTQASSGSNSELGDLLAIDGGIELAGMLFAMFAFGARSKTRKHQFKS